MPYTAGAQYFTTQLSVVGGITATQTTGIILQNLDRVIDLSKPSIVAVDWTKLPDGSLDTSVVEFIGYQSINPETNELQGVVRGLDGFSAKAHNNGAVIAYVISASHINGIYDFAQPENFISEDENNSLVLGSDEKLFATGSDSTKWVSGPSTAVLSDFDATALTATLTFPLDVSPFISAPMRGRLKDSSGAIHYFYYTSITGSVAQLLLYDTIANGNVSEVMYSGAEMPYGFPGDFKMGDSSGESEYIELTNSQLVNGWAVYDQYGKSFFNVTGDMTYFYFSLFDGLSGGEFTTPFTDPRLIPASKIRGASGSIMTLARSYPTTDQYIFFTPSNRWFLPGTPGTQFQASGSFLNSLATD